jgi:hypothetical protein
VTDFEKKCWKVSGADATSPQECQKAGDGSSEVICLGVYCAEESPEEKERAKRRHEMLGRKLNKELGIEEKPKPNLYRPIPPEHFDHVEEEKEKESESLDLVLEILERIEDNLRVVSDKLDFLLKKNNVITKKRK